MIRKAYFSLLVVTIGFLTSCSKEDLPQYDYKTLGTSAHDLLVSSGFSSLIIEVDYMPGYEPDGTSLINLQNFLEMHINKPGGIQIIQKQIPSSGQISLSVDNLVEIEKHNRTKFSAGTTIAVHILIVDADFTGSPLFGLAYWNTSFCLFGKNIFYSSGGTGQVRRSVLMTTLLEHEFGHLLGLVDQGSPMQTAHRDTANGAHCDNQSCLMYYGIESTANGTIPLPDSSCVADLKANGGK